MEGTGKKRERDLRSRTLWSGSIGAMVDFGDVGEFEETKFVMARWLCVFETIVQFAVLL